MNPALATISALGTAALFAVASAVHAKALRDSVHAPRSITSYQLLTVMRAFRSLARLVGTAIATLAFGLHAIALHEGSLSLVQPLLVTMVIFPLPAGRWAAGPRQPI
jgi:uncharacterized protein YcfJ